MNVEDITDYVKAGKGALDLLKSLRDLMPKGGDREKINERLAEAEKALGLAEAQAAKALGYKLCMCTFPPQIMRWREQEKLYLCPNPECGRKHRGTPEPDRGGGGRFTAARRGR